jgi:hypothetical protein
MIEMTHYPGFLGGLLAGFVHATMLWRTSQRLSAWTPLLGLLRLGIVATVLVVAAVYGQILAAAGAWAICFAMSAVLYACAGSKYEQTSGTLNSTELSDAKCN